MGPLSQQEYQTLLDGSEMFKKYRESVDPLSAFEILNERVQAATQQKEKSTAENKVVGKSAREEKSTFEQVMTSPVAKQVGRELVRGVFGMLFGSAPRRTTRRRY